MPYKIATLAGEPYRPSNGTEGMMFAGMFCDKCRFNKNESGCPILAFSFACAEEDDLYPRQYWIHDEEGRPTCRAFLEG